VTSRGNERKAIFRDDTDREKFLELIGRAVELASQRLLIQRIYLGDHTVRRRQKRNCLDRHDQDDRAGERANSN